MERGAWGRAAAARRRGGARGSRGPAARAHRARRRAASLRASASPRTCPRLPERVPTPPAWPGSRHPLPRPSNRSSSPLSGPGCRSPPRLAGARLAAQGSAWPGQHEAGPGSPSLIPSWSGSPPRERPERGRGIRLDRRVPPTGVATVTGWLARQFEVPSRLPVRPVDGESCFGEGAFPREHFGGAWRGAERKVPPDGAVRGVHAAVRGRREDPLLGFLLFPMPGLLPGPPSLALTQEVPGGSEAPSAPAQPSPAGLPKHQQPPLSARQPLLTHLLLGQALTWKGRVGKFQDSAFQSLRHPWLVGPPSSRSGDFPDPPG